MSPRHHPINLDYPEPEHEGQPAQRVRVGQQLHLDHSSTTCSTPADTDKHTSTDSYSTDDAATITPFLPPDSSSPPLSPTSSTASLSSPTDSQSSLDEYGPGSHHSNVDPRSRWEDTWSEDELQEPLHRAADRARDGVETARERRERRRRERKVYGGGRHAHGGEDDDELEGGEEGSGELSVGEVGGMVLAGSLSPTPLLLPLAAARLGPTLFVPLLALAAALGWLSAVTVGVEGRYVGARSFPALASAVFPHRFKLHLVGELLASVYVLLGSVLRTTLGVVAAAEVAVDLIVPDRKRRDWERLLAVLSVCGAWFLIPLVIPPLLRLLQLDALFYPPTSSSVRYTRLAPTCTADLSTSFRSPYPSSASSPDERRRPRWTALLRLPAYSLAFVTWPLALLILGVRLKRLNHDASSPSSALLHADGTFLADIPLFAPEDEQGSLWPPILLTFSALLTAGHETFFYLTSLVRPSSTSTARRRRQSRHGDGNAGGSGGVSFSRDLPAGAGGAGEGAPAATTAADREGKRNQYPLAIAVGLGISFLIHLGWALVGSLGLSPALSHGHREGGGGEVELPSGNLLSDSRLKRGDGWLGMVRLLVLVGILGQLSTSARLGIGRAQRGLAYLRPSPSSSSSSSSPAPPSSSSPWRKILARLLIWSAIAACSWLVVAVPKVGREGQGGKREVGGHGTGLVYCAEWATVALGGIGGCLGPALAYLSLFHLRPPRTIFTSSPSSPHFSTDALLQRKERQVQRRLSGRRVWTDVGVFGLLGPVGVVLVARGVWALVSG
ncbi:hypothetical protein JCM11641_007596 [Rhodosporidiobolus odoratus]